MLTLEGFADKKIKPNVDWGLLTFQIHWVLDVQSNEFNQKLIKVLLTQITKDSLLAETY